MHLCNSGISFAIKPVLTKSNQTTKLGDLPRILRLLQNVDMNGTSSAVDTRVKIQKIQLKNVRMDRDSCMVGGKSQASGTRKIDTKEHMESMTSKFAPL